MRKLVLPLLILSLISCALYFTNSSRAAVTTTIAPAGTPLNPQNFYNFVTPAKAAGCTRSSGVPMTSYRLNITTPGSYTFTINPSGFAGRVYVYQNKFNPLEPCQNIVNQTDSGGFYITTNPLTLTLNASAVNSKWVVVFTANNINSSGTFSASVDGPAAVTIEPNVTTQIAPAGTPLNSQNYSWKYPTKGDCTNQSGVVSFAAYTVDIPVEGLYSFAMNATGFTGRVFVYSAFDPTQPCYAIENSQDTSGLFITGSAITLPVPVFFTPARRTIIFTSTEPVSGTFSASITGPAAVTLNQSELTIDSQSSSKSVSAGCVQTLSVYALGPGPQHFQWYEGVAGDMTNSVIIPGANSNNYTTPALVGDKSYWVRVSYGDDFVDSATIRFKVYSGTNTPFKGILDPLQTWNLKTVNCNTAGTNVHYRAFHMRIPVSGQYKIHLNNTSFGQYAITTYSNSFDATQPCVNFNGGVTNTDNIGFLPGGQDTIIVVSATTTTGLGSFEGYISSIDSCTLPETIEDALIISGSPLDQAVTPGNTATLQFAFSGGSAGAKTIQWYKGVSGDTSQPVSGAGSTTYTTPALSQVNNETTYYYYWARVDDPDSFTHADTATAVVSVINPPITYSDVLTQCDEQYAQVNGPTTYYKIYPFKVSTPGTYNFNVTANGFTPKTALYHGIFFPQFPNVNYSGNATSENLIASANNYYLVITTPNANQTGSFTVNVTGPSLVVPSLRPEIKTHPTDQTILRGQTATLGVTTNSPALSYQWYTGSCTNKTAVNGNLISYTTPPLTDYKDYWVKVSYGVMYVNSNIAHVRIKPEAINDSYTTDEDVRLDIPAPGVLANDKKADSRDLRAEEVSGGNLGGVHPENTGALSYSPNSNANGTDSFTYRVKDGTLTSDSGTITITIREINDAPFRTGGSVNDHTFNEDGASNILHLGGLSYSPGGGSDEATQQLIYRVTAVPPSTVGNVQLVDGTAVSANTNYTITQIQGMKFAPAANGNGAYPFTFTVTDNGTSRGVADPKTLTQSMNITVRAIADLPTATSITTNEDTLSPAIVIDRNAVDGAEVTHFRVDQFQSGTLFKNDGVTQLTNESVITYAEAHAGLKFKPAANLFSPGSTFRFNLQALIGNSFDQFSSNDLTVLITVNPVAELPSVTGTSTFVNQQSSGGLVITRSNQDGAEIGYFKLSSMTNGTLFKNDGTTQIANGQLITAAEATAGLKFTPANNSTATGSFQVQGAASATGDGLGPAATATITVSKSATSTTITSLSHEPSYLGQQITVYFSVANNSGTAQPTGNVTITVSGGSETCTALAEAGACLLTLNTAGNPRVLTATYEGNASFESSSGTKDHVVEACTPNTVVTSLADDGTAGTLRSVIDNACAGSTVTFDPAVFNPANGPYTIALGTFGNIAENLLIDQNLTIVGPGAAVITIRRSTATRTKHFRIFNVAAGMTASISGLTISDGFANGGPDPRDADGGAILNAGTLTLKNSAVTASQAGRAGLTSASGGGIYNTGTLTLINTTVSGNNAFISNGGGLFVASGSVANIINSTISGNTSPVSGGGLYVLGTANIFNSTITNNTATVSGGGVYHELGSTTVGNVIIAGNSAPVAPDVNAVSGSITSNGHNLIGKNDGSEAAFLSGNPNSNADLVGTSASPLLAMLAPLANNGGPTQTHLPLPESPALNAGNNSILPIDTLDVNDNGNTAELLPVDQRGLGRVADTTVDIGAVEVSYSFSSTTGDNQSAIINTAFATQLQVTVTESGAPKSGVPVTFTAPSAGASGSFADAPVVMTDANGVATAPVFTANGIIGSYTVNATINGSLSSSFNLTNTQGQAQVAIGNLSQTYDGSAKSVLVTTSPAGLAVNITYDGSNTLPVNAGSYSVVVTSADPNYTGQASETLVIGKADQTISFTAPGNKTAGDAPFALTASATSNIPVSFNIVSGPATIAGNMLTITGVGTVVVQASQPGDNNFNAASSVDQSFSVSKIDATLALSNLSHTYDGTGKSATVVTTPANLTGVTVQYSQNGTPIASPIHAGSYDVTATLTNDRYQASSVNGTLVIGKASQSIDFAPLSTKTFREPDFLVSATATSRLDIFFTASGSCWVVNGSVHLVGAGTCSINATQSGNENYSAAEPVTNSFTVDRAAAEITLGSLSHTYDGNPKSATTTTNPAGLTVQLTYDGSSTVPVNAGTYSVVATISLPNYVGTASGQLTIGKASSAITWSNPSDITYGTPLGATQLNATSSVPGSIAYSPNGGTVLNAGPQSLTAEFTPTDGNNYEAASKTVTVNVAKAPQTITFGQLVNKKFGDADFTVSANVNSSLAVNLSANGPCALSGNTVHITGVGSCNLTASQDGNENYLAATPVSQSFTIEKGTATVTIDGLSYTYDGAAKSATTTTNPSGLTVNITYNGSATAPVNAGNYAVVATVNDQNYEGTVTAQLTIGKGTPVVTWTNQSPITYGTSLSASQLSATSNVPGSFNYTPASGTLLNAGMGQTLSVSFTATDSANYNGANKGVTIDVLKASQTIDFAHIANKTFGDTDFNINANATSQLTVSFSATGQCSVLGNTIKINGAGSCTITASQAGNDNYLAATPVSQTFSIVKSAASVSLSNLSYVYDGAEKKPTASTTPAGLTVALTYDGSTSAPTNAGSYSVVATINDSNYEGSAIGQLVITKATPVISWTTPASITYGTPLDAALLNATATVPGTFEYEPGVGTVLNAGTHQTLKVNFTPDDAGNYNLAAKQVQVDVLKASQSITFGSLLNKTFGDAPFSLNASASSTLNVSFTVVSGPATLSGNVLTMTGAGSVKIRASQPGNENYEAATPVEQTLTVSQAAANVGVASSANPSESGQSVTFTARVTSTAGTATGSIQFQAGGVNLGGPITLNSSGVATFTTSTLTIGTHPITAVYSGDTNFTAGNGTLSQVVGEQPPLFSFASATYSVNEADGFVRVTVTRSGQTSSAVSVDYATDDTGSPSDCSSVNGLASIRCDVTALYGTLTFAANETQKSIDIPITLDSYTEGPESFRVNLSNPSSGAALVVPSTTAITINDSAAPAPNAIDDTTNFVRQQYHDFLNREPDPSGLAFWKQNIDKCDDPSQRQPGQTLEQCIEIQRVITSAAFFLSIEFKETGGLVRDLYVAALNRPATNNMPGLLEFQRDAQKIQQGVIVNEGNWEQTLTANRLAFVNEFVMRDEFTGLYPTTDSPTQYVDKLYLHAGLVPTAQERADAIAEFGFTSTASDLGARGRALLRITKSGTFQGRELNRSFVHMQYLGYLRRNPNAAPDTNFAGFDFWLNKLNEFSGDFLQAEMVKAFITSGEYRQRFGH
jgi:hypothetical protein